MNYSDVNVSFELYGPNGRYSCHFPTNHNSIFRVITPGIYDVGMVAADGRPNLNGSIGLLQAEPDYKKITVVAGETTHLSFNVWGAGL